VKKPISKGLRVPENPIYLTVIFLLSLVLVFYDWRVGLIAIAFAVYLAFYNWRITRKRSIEWTRYLEDLSENIDWSTKNAVFSIPMPFVVVELDGSINWYNPRFGQLFEEESLLGENIKDYIPELNPFALLAD
jgi:c-di-AMP phosphodiesterase-like protein